MTTNAKCQKKSSDNNHIYVKTNETPIVQDVKYQPYAVPVISPSKYSTSSSSNTDESLGVSICQASCGKSIKNESICPPPLQKSSSRLRDGFIADAILHIIWSAIILGVGISISIRTDWKHWITTLTGICLFSLAIILLIISFQCQHPILPILKLQKIQFCIALIGFGLSIYQISRDEYGFDMQYTKKILTVAVVIKGVAIVTLFTDLILNTYLHRKRSSGRIDIDNDRSIADK